jgi:hypothetical protein
MNRSPEAAESLDTSNLRESLWKAVNWLTRSGIVNTDPSRPDTYGSVNAYFDTGRDKYAFAYSEITGYAVTLFVYLYKIYNDKILQDRAIDASKWLMEKALDRNLGGCLCRYDHDDRDFEPRRVCTFDNGMILNGIVSLYRITRNSDLLEFAMKIANWLIFDMQNEDGSFNVRYVYFKEKPRIGFSYNKWSSQTGAFLCKTSLGLLNLYDVSGEKIYREAAISSGKAALRFQHRDGRFITNALQGYTHLHPHCYTCEAMYVLGNYLHDSEFVESALQGTQWALGVMNSTYGFPTLYSPNEIVVKGERNDINAQATRLLILRQLNGFETPNRTIERCIENMLRFHMHSSDQRLDGAFTYGFDEEKGVEVSHPNSWVTMFAVQALTMYMRNLVDGEVLDYLLLV